MICIGVDAHQSFSTLFAVDYETGEVLLDLDKVPTTPEAFATALGEGFTEAVAVVEASTISCFVVEMLRPFVAETVIADPKLVRQSVPHGRAKTDRNDARELARQLHAGLISEVFQHTPDGLARRALTRSTRSVTCSGTRLRSQLRSLLRIWGVQCRYRDLCGRGAERFMQQLQLREPAQTAASELYRLLQEIESTRQGLKRRVRSEAKQLDQVKLLQSLPGIGAELGLRIASEVGDIERFPSDGAFVKYCGLAPGIEQSGERRRTCKLVKGNEHLKTALCQAANAIACNYRGSSPLHECYRSALRRLGRKKACLAVARKLARDVWQMLRRNEPYRFA
jgi:transposase